MIHHPPEGPTGDAGGGVAGSGGCRSFHCRSHRGRHTRVQARDVHRAQSKRNQVKYRPILFRQPHADEMVRAILDERKTQTRRPVKLGNQAGALPEFHHLDELQTAVFTDGTCVRSPFGTVGHRLWVRETWAWSEYAARHEEVLWRAYRYYSDEELGGLRWRPSIHMPRWASRIDLEITRVWVERVQDITEEDAKKEGVESVMFQNEQFWKAYGSNPIPGGGELTATRLAAQSFRTLWQSIYGTWDANPFVWAYEFRRIKP